MLQAQSKYILINTHTHIAKQTKQQQQKYPQPITQNLSNFFRLEKEMGTHKDAQGHMQASIEAASK